MATFSAIYMQTNDVLCDRTTFCSFLVQSLEYICICSSKPHLSLRSIIAAGIFTCDGYARDPYFYVPAETQSYVIKLSCSRKVLAASGV